MSLRLQLRLQLPALLRSVRRGQVHQHWIQNVIRLQAHPLELVAYIVNLVWWETLLDDAAYESGELRLLPSLGVAQLDVHEVQALECMVDVNATEEVYAALLACVALNDRR